VKRAARRWPSGIEPCAIGNQNGGGERLPRARSRFPRSALTSVVRASGGIARSPNEGQRLLLPIKREVGQEGVSSHAFHAKKTIAINAGASAMIIASACMRRL